MMDRVRSESSPFGLVSTGLPAPHPHVVVDHPLRTPTVRRAHQLVVVVAADLDDGLTTLTRRGNHRVGEVRRRARGVAVELDGDLPDDVLVAQEPAQPLLDP